MASQLGLGLGLGLGFPRCPRPPPAAHLRAPSLPWKLINRRAATCGSSSSSSRAKGLPPVSAKSVHGGESPPPSDRVVAASAYFLPLLDGIQYGKFFFQQFPQAQDALQPIYPLLRIYSSTPFASVLLFFGLYFLCVRNPNVNRYVRFNTMQAIVLDVLLILPGLVENSFHPTGGVGLEALVVFYNTVFLYLVVCFFLGSGSCLIGRVPRLPLVADAADAQVF